ncbi:MAG TPA: hypothetical protein VL101_03235 [Nordella sp.]|nr:hypothetical protein [Nordella sp.]
MTLETLFTLVQVPIVGAIAGFVVFRQLRKSQPNSAVKAGLFAGIGAAVLYAALKFLL